jgi:MOSC domain-containing protein YiiM
VADPATVEAVNVGVPRPVQLDGHTVWTAIWKRPVEGRVPLRGVNLRGDDQADRTVHGGPDKAVYAYGAEDTEWWEAELGRPLGPGAFGENLTTRGLPVSEAVIGERWAVGSTLLEVAQPRLPCFKLGLRMGDPRFLKRFAAAARPGAYLRVGLRGRPRRRRCDRGRIASGARRDERPRLARAPGRAPAAVRGAAGHGTSR